MNARIEGFVWVTPVIASLITLVVVIVTTAEKGARCRRQDTAKDTACATARASVPLIQRALRREPDTGVALAHQLGLWMRYCDGAQGAALARVVEEAILAGIPQHREDPIATIDVGRIADALTTFAREAPP